MRMLISHSNKYIYHMNPKVGSNTTLTILYRLAGMDEDAIGNPHRTSRDDGLLEKHGLVAVDLVNEECAEYFSRYSGYFTFSFTRNPFTRLKSAYNDKLKRYAEIATPELLKKLQQMEGVEKTKKFFQVELKKHISFGQFVKGVCADHLYGDQHWVPQIDRLRPDLCKFDVLGKLETYNEDMTNILIALGVGEGDLPTFPARLNSAPDSRSIGDYYNDELIRLVKNSYHRDFEEFGYAITLP